MEFVEARKWHVMLDAWHELVLKLCRLRIETLLGSSVGPRILEERHLQAKIKDEDVKANFHLFSVSAACNFRAESGSLGGYEYGPSLRNLRAIFKWFFNFSAIFSAVCIKGGCNFSSRLAVISIIGCVNHQR